METYTIQEAAEKWIATVNDPATKATPEQKADVVAKIRAAAPVTRWIGIGTGPEGLPAAYRGTFSDAVANLRREIRRMEAK